MVHLDTLTPEKASRSMNHDSQQNDQRWQAIVNKEAAADGKFFFAVKTTGVYCFPSCGSRTPKRDNVEFFVNRADAEGEGFRACRRCRPDLPPLAVRHAEAITKACEIIANANETVSLKTLAESAGMSPFYFQRTFKRIVGITPKQYEVAQRNQRIKVRLRADASVTDAIYASGFNASSRYYEHAHSRLGMTASQLKGGGKGLAIEYTITDCWLGRVLIAATHRGICAIYLADQDCELTEAIHVQFPKATINEAKTGSQLDQWAMTALEMIDNPSMPNALPLDVMGTAFQERVWRALRSIAPGETASYSQIAKDIGEPKATRAVAKACAANAAAIAIPCHRVIRADGALSGYRWGPARKERILERERSIQAGKNAGKENTIAPEQTTKFK